MIKVFENYFGNNSKKINDSGKRERVIAYSVTLSIIMKKYKGHEDCCHLDLNYAKDNQIH